MDYLYHQDSLQQLINVAVLGVEQHFYHLFGSVVSMVLKLMNRVANQGMYQAMPLNLISHSRHRYHQTYDVPYHRLGEYLWLMS